MTREQNPNLLNLREQIEADGDHTITDANREALDGGGLRFRPEILGNDPRRPGVLDVPWRGSEEEILAARSRRWIGGDEEAYEELVRRLRDDET